LTPASLQLTVEQERFIARLSMPAAAKRAQETEYPDPSD